VHEAEKVPTAQGAREESVKMQARNSAAIAKKTHGKKGKKREAHRKK